MRGLITLVLGLVLALPCQAEDAASEPTRRPNILWIVSEDNGPFLGCYGSADAETPHLDRLAAEGILYRNAFAAAPVCAPSRSSIITGMEATSLGTEHMRSTNFVPPDKFPFFTKSLRDAGYFCTNRSKTDYNLRPYQVDAWDMIKQGDHRKRAAGQPFFAVYNFETSHESSLHRPLDPSPRDARVTLPPYHPDTPEIRANWAMYHRAITRMDAEVGRLLAEIEKEGLADDTIVFYYSDHGGALPRSKRFLYDTGLHVPLLVRFGKNFSHLAPQAAGTATERLVSLMDLGPTVLSLAGVEIPAHMRGRAFLGKSAVEPREFVYAFRDRMDERYDLSRAVRDTRFKYIRNYNPWRIYGQHLAYLWKMPATRSWEEAFLAGRCNEIQSAFWRPKPVEELYDTQADPWEVNNLAADPRHAATLARLREENRRHLLAIHDAGFLPEAEMVTRAGEGSIYELANDPARYPLPRILAAAELAGQATVADLPDLLKLLEADDAAERYWGAMGCVALGDKATAAFGTLNARLDDTSPSVRIAAAEALIRQDASKQSLNVLRKLLSHDNRYVALHAANVLEAIGEDARPALPGLHEAAKSDDEYLRRSAEQTVRKLGD